MKRRIAAIVVALVVAVLGATAVIRYANAADARAVAGQDVKKVYIAQQTVPKGTTAREAVDKGLIALQGVVAKGVPRGAMRSLSSDRAKLVALSDIAAGEVVLTDRFGSRSEVLRTGGVPEGKVAISLSLSAPEGVAPLLSSGSHIAIYDTFNSRSKSGPLAPYGAHLTDDKASVRGTGVVLPDVTVLRVDGKPTADEPSQSPSQEELLVTVAVAPGQSARLVHAIQSGDLYAALLGRDAEVDSGSTSNDNNVVRH